MNDDLTSLEGTLDAVWQRLLDGVERSEAPARHVALASARTNGGGAVRLVVLRAAERKTGTLNFYTHRASSKVGELRTNPRCEVLVWDAEAHFQIRLRMTARVSDGPSDLWKSFGQGTRRNYAASPLPGTHLETADAFDPDADAAQFMVIACKIDEIETLHLGRSLQRRALFKPSSSIWIAP